MVELENEKSIRELLEEYEKTPEDIEYVEGWPKGFSMEFNLNIPIVLHHAYDYYPKAKIIARTYEDKIVEKTYADFFDNSIRLANAIKEIATGPHGFIGLLSDNIVEGAEAKAGIWLAGYTPEFMNIAFGPEILAHGARIFKEEVIIVSKLSISKLEAVADRLPAKHYIAIPDLPQEGTKLKQVYSYKELIKNYPSTLEEWPNPPEWSASFTTWSTGTTGLPKPCVHNHKDAWCQIIGHAMRGDLGIGPGDSLLHVIPLHHAGHWLIDLTGMLYGNTQVFPGPTPTPEWIVKLIEIGKVTFTAGVPRVWEEILNYVEAEERKGRKINISSLKRLHLAGMAPSIELQKRLEERGIQPIHGWGMSEGPDWGAWQATPKPYIDYTVEELRVLRRKQGLPTPGMCRARVVDEQGREVPKDGATVGELQEKGVYVVSKYYKRPDKTKESFTEDGWFRTGDLATVDPEGYIEIVDRTQDIIKSKSGLISSIRIENEAVAHPKIVAAACTFVPHPEEKERPILLVIPYLGEKVTEEEILKFLAPRFPNWYLPDKIIVVDKFPLTSVGKIDKATIRKMYKDYKLPEKPLRLREGIKRLSLE